MSRKDPYLKINGKIVAYEPNSFMHSKGYAKRNFFPDTAGKIYITEDSSTRMSTVSFKLRSTSENEELFNEFVSFGSNNSITFSRDGLNTSVSNCAIENSDVSIEIGADSTFEVIFKGNPVIE